MFLPISFFFLVFILLFNLYHPKSNQFNFLLRKQNSHVSTNLVHILYWMQSIGTMPFTSLKNNWIQKFKNKVKRTSSKFYILLLEQFIWTTCIV